MSVTGPAPAPTIFVLPHTHWDREWYLTFERFRLLLVGVLDRLLSIMRADPAWERFTLDGQSIVLDDYLALRPEQEPLIRELVAQGRLAVGPWYVLPDEFLVSGEALVRNLLLGRARTARFGRPMAVGYLPDSFGHVAQLPQILRGFGIESAMCTRGVGDEGERLGSEFHWEALDGSRVLAVHQVRGYCNGAALGYREPSALREGRAADPALAAEQVEREVESLRPHSRSGVVLINNGCDHLPPTPNLPRVIEHLRQTHRSIEIRWGTPQEVAEEILARGPELSTWRGELRGSRYAPLLPGVLSARIHLKQANEAAQTLLERWAEPFAVFAGALGEPDPSRFLQHAWELLLQNHPHDSICGCSVDAVHREMLTRFEKAAAVGSEIASRGLDAIARRVATDALPEGLPLLLFNPLGSPRSEVVRCAMSLPAALASGVSAQDGSGEPVGFQVLRRSREVLTRGSLAADPIDQRLAWLEHEVETAWHVRFAAFRLSGNALAIEAAEPEACTPGVVDRMASTIRRRRDRLPAAAEGESNAALAVTVNRSIVELALAAREIPAVGYSTVVLQKRRTVGEPTPYDVRINGTSLENRFVTVDVMVDGTITLRDKTTGRLFRGHVLEDAGDAGDAYDYSPLDEPPILSTGLPGKVKMIHAGPLVGTVRVTLPLRLPARLGANRRHRTPGRVACPITLDVTVTAGSPIVEFTTTVENRAEDHRLRVLFSTGIHSDRWAADTAFGVVERSTTRPAGEGWTQRPQPTAPHQSWVDATDGGAGLAVLSTGLPEHEVIDSGEGLNVALTLLRCVGSLSRDDLRTRAGHAGPGYPTPEAQCLGAHRFRYALFAHAGGWEEAGVPARALDWRVPMRAEPTSRHPGSLPGAHTFVTCEGAMLSAIKPPERGEGFIIRVYNSGATEGRAVIRANLPLREVREVSLGEEDIGDVGSQDGVIELVMRPFQIRTIRLVLRE